MDTPVAVALGVALFIAVAAAFVRAARRRADTAAEADSSDDETSGPLSVSVVADHDEQDSLLPKFAGLLRSPWHSVSDGKKEQQQPKVMRPVRRTSRSMSLTMPLPLRKKRKPAEVPVKKIHVPYFFPLLDETAEWWQSQQPAVEPQPTPEEEPDASEESRSIEDSKISNNTPTEGSCARDMSPARQTLQPEHSQIRFPAVELAALPIEVEGR
ncbi:unnamed protein product [Phytophthora fragariaefolia]|uniref:Unnamed protein product n=1 Tax=Phytophthora fragariaefolia TaxID=1490495 RepID=A0A9W6XY55_9STRA|nr:unnamed protein product [Phytophthora fragariaefolia]